MGDPLRSALAQSLTAMPPEHAGSDEAGLKILHILRAPLGGLFRHVIDLVQGQAQRGHRVGLFLDSTTGGARAEAVLRDLAPYLALGFERVAIPRELSPRDAYALYRVARRVAALKPDALHGHGAKGAAYRRGWHGRNSAPAAPIRRTAARWSSARARSAAASIVRWSGC